MREPSGFVPDPPESIDKGDEDACDESRFPLPLERHLKMIRQAASRFANDAETTRFEHDPASCQLLVIDFTDIDGIEGCERTF